MKIRGKMLHGRLTTRISLGAMRAGLAIALTLLVAGCMLGPNYKQPPTRVANQWLESGTSAISSDQLEYRDWWSTFKDPALTRLIELAYQQNLTLLSAGVHVLEARAQLGIAIGEFYPQQQQLTAAVAYNRIPLSSPFNFITNTFWNDSFGAQAAWELDVWGKLRRGIESADSAYLASVANYDDVLVTLTGDVASDYVQIRTSQRQIVIAKKNAQKQRIALKIATARWKGGAATKRDVYQAENVLGSTEAAIPQLTIQLRQEKNALSVLLGMPPGPLDSLLAGASDIPTAPAQVAVGIPADLLRRRPDVRHAELQAVAQCAQIGFAKADLFPSLTLLGNVGTVSTNIGKASLSDVFTADSLAFAVGPTLQWNILNYGQIT
ncbi:MAG TPA: efflux transporter outer membrane subunit, partial [Candidatus Binataceae bacterium]